MTKHGRSSCKLPAVLGAICGAAISGQTLAADTTSAAPDQSALGITDPTPDGALRAFSPDRPARASSPITVDAGRFQIESDFGNATIMNQQGTSTRTLQAVDPVVKLGATDFADVEVGFGGFVDTRTTANATSATISKGSGFADVTLATKFNVVGNEGGQYAFALIPYLRVPSGTRNVSDGQVEGGLIAPSTIALPNDFTLELQTEVDALRNVNGPGTHASFTDIVNVSHAVPGIKDLTGTVEFYSSISTERHSANEYTFDAALAYLVDTDTQLDLATNVGLNRGTPDYQVYAGVSHRF